MIRHSDERNLLPEPYEEFVVAGREFRRFRSTEFYYQSTYDYVTGLLTCNGRSIDDVVRFLHPWRRVLSEFSRDQFLRFSNDCKWNVEEDPWVLLGRGFLVFHQTYFSYGCGPAFVPLDADPWTGDGELYRGRNRVLEQLEEHGWMQGIENGLEYAVVSPRWDEAFRLTRKQLLRPSEELYTIMRDSRLALVEDDAVIGIALANGYIMGSCRVSDDVPKVPEDAWGFSAGDSEKRHGWAVPGGRVPDDSELAAAVSEAKERIQDDMGTPPSMLYRVRMDMDFVLLVADDNHDYVTDGFQRYIQPLVESKVLVIGLDDYRRHLGIGRLDPIHPCGNARGEGA